MLVVILKSVFIVGMAAAFIYWLHALTESDGHCHFESCKGCPYSEDCPERKEKHEGDSEE